MQHVLNVLHGHKNIVVARIMMRVGVYSVIIIIVVKGRNVIKGRQYFSTFSLKRIPLQQF